MADFHHLDDAREIWLAMKARFGGNEESKKIRKTMLKQEFFEFSVSEKEGLHKGYDQFQKILSQLNQMQAKPDNDDVNMKFLRALPPSWSQVALTLKTRGGLKYLSFDDLYNKLRTNIKMVYSDQPSHSSSFTYTFAHSGSIMEDVDQIEMEEVDIKWQMAMLSPSINRFQKKAGRKINFNNKDPARFDRKKARCYNCLQGENRRAKGYDFADHAGNAAGSVSDAAVEFAMMGISPKLSRILFFLCSLCIVKPSIFLNHHGRRKPYPYSRILGDYSRPSHKGYRNTIELPDGNNVMPLQSDTIRLVQIGCSFYEIRSEDPNQHLKDIIKIVDSLDLNDENKTKLGLGFKEYIRSDEVFDLSTPNVFDPKPENREVKSLYERFVKAGKMHKVPSSITRTFMPTSYKSNLEETQETFGSKSNTSSINTSESNDFDSSNNSDKSSESETYDFASSVSSPKTNDSFSTVDVKILPKSDVKDPSPTNGFPSCSFKENVKPPRNLYNFPFVVLKAAFVPAAHFLAGRSVPTGWTNHAARPFFRPTTLYFDNVSWPGIYDHMSMNEGIWGSAVKSPAGTRIDGRNKPKGRLTIV
nr:ribonuclease H-like domain-containing protein [Tanacetum cinerariifolium]